MTTVHPATRSVRGIGTTSVVAVADPAAAAAAERILVEELCALDEACSRFRPDAELARVHAAGHAVPVSPLLFEVLRTACRVAESTHGAVDPTVGSCLEALGYDRDLIELDPDDERPATPVPAPGWHRVELDEVHRTVSIPRGVVLDVGSSAKALLADRVAMRAALELGTGTLVSCGGDVAAAGPAPAGGWSVGIARSSSSRPDEVDQVVRLAHGGLASSSPWVRAWRRSGVQHHHVVDPATGSSVPVRWSVVSVAAPSCVAANALTTAALVWGASAPRRLAALGWPARLAGLDGRSLQLCGWPHAAPLLETSEVRR